MDWISNAMKKWFFWVYIVVESKVDILLKIIYISLNLCLPRKDHCLNLMLLSLMVTHKKEEISSINNVLPATLLKGTIRLPQPQLSGKIFNLIQYIEESLEELLDPLLSPTLNLWNLLSSIGVRNTCSSLSRTPQGMSLVLKWLSPVLRTNKKEPI